jgi:hypothetical protein
MSFLLYFSELTILTIEMFCVISYNNYEIINFTKSKVKPMSMYHITEQHTYVSCGGSRLPDTRGVTGKNI